MARSALTVLQLVPSLRGGGVEQGTLDVCAALAADGHRALVMSAGGPMVEAIVKAGGEHLQWPIGDKSPLTLRFVPKLARLFSQQRIDIVHPRSRLPAWIAWLAWKAQNEQRRPRLVTSVHGFYSPGRYSAIMTRGERVICVSDAVHDYVLKTFPQTPPERLQVIHRGIDPADFPHGFAASAQWRQRWLEQFPQFAGAKLVLLPGRITRLKGHEHLIGLIAGLRKRGVNAHGMIAGGIDPRRRQYAEELHQRIAHEGLSEHVHFLGHRQDLREVMSVSDLVLSLSSKPESFGRTVLEALSLGRPVVGFAHGGVEEVLRKLHPAGLTPVDDAGALLTATDAVLRNPPQVAPVHDYTLQRMLTQTLDLYKDLAVSAREVQGSSVR